MGTTNTLVNRSKKGFCQETLTTEVWIWVLALVPDGKF